MGISHMSLSPEATGLSHKGKGKKIFSSNLCDLAELNSLVQHMVFPADFVFYLG